MSDKKLVLNELLEGLEKDAEGHERVLTDKENQSIDDLLQSEVADEDLLASLADDIEIKTRDDFDAEGFNDEQAPVSDNDLSSLGDDETVEDETELPDDTFVDDALSSGEDEINSDLPSLGDDETVNDETDFPDDTFVDDALSSGEDEINSDLPSLGGDETVNNEIDFPDDTFVDDVLSSGEDEINSDLPSLGDDETVNSETEFPDDTFVDDVLSSGEDEINSDLPSLGDGEETIENETDFSNDELAGDSLQEDEGIAIDNDDIAGLPEDVDESLLDEGVDSNYTESNDAEQDDGDNEASLVADLNIDIDDVLNDSIYENNSDLNDDELNSDIEDDHISEEIEDEHISDESIHEDVLQDDFLYDKDTKEDELRDIEEQATGDERELNVNSPETSIESETLGAFTKTADTDTNNMMNSEKSSDKTSKEPEEKTQGSLAKIGTALAIPLALIAMLSAFFWSTFSDKEENYKQELSGLHEKVKIIEKENEINKKSYAITSNSIESLRKKINDMSQELSNEKDKVAKLYELKQEQDRKIAVYEDEMIKRLSMLIDYASSLNNKIDNQSTIITDKVLSATMLELSEKLKEIDTSGVMKDFQNKINIVFEQLRQSQAKNNSLESIISVLETEINYLKGTIKQQQEDFLKFQKTQEERAYKKTETDSHSTGATEHQQEQSASVDVYQPSHVEHDGKKNKTPEYKIVAIFQKAVHTWEFYLQSKDSTGTLNVKPYVFIEGEKTIIPYYGEIKRVRKIENSQMRVPYVIETENGNIWGTL
jgi:hypothetical protein